MSDFPFDHDSGKSMNRHRSNAKAEANLERRKLRDKIEWLRERERELVKALEDALVLIKSVAGYSDQPLFQKDAVRQVEQIESVLRKDQDGEPE